jgi:protein gp37
MDLKIHPLAHCLPDIPEDQFKALKEDISGLGVLYPIVLLDGMILDGRHRYRACQELGIECPTKVINDVSPNDLVRSMNLFRRHLNESQRAMVAAALLEPFEKEAKERQGERTDLKNNIVANLPQSKKRNPPATDKAAEALGVSGRLVRDAKIVYTEGTPEEIESATNGKTPVSSIAKEIRKNRPPEILTAKPKKPMIPKTAFNETNENIGWAAYSWNPVTGCENGCPYCYAKAISDRYGWTFKPTLHEDRIGPIVTKRKENKNNRVFTCSMGELFGPWVPDEWICKVFDVVRDNPEWLFLFLTKNPERLPMLEWPDNARIGATIDKQSRVHAVTEAFQALDAAGIQNKRFISCEPLLELIELPKELLKILDWLIIGSKSEGQIKIQPNVEWVNDLFLSARKYNIPVWFKDNLIFRPQEDCNNVS